MFQGRNVLSKAFGEFVEHHYGTPSISAASFHKWIDRDEPLFLIDGRTPEEHQAFSIPGATHCANGDLPLLVDTLIENPEQPVVVHCAGRTRSIIGAQTLRDHNIPNPVYALQNGTLDWQFEGYALEYGISRQASLNNPPAVRARLPENCFIDKDKLAIWQHEEARTTYLLDIRSAEEFMRGSLEGARHAPAGQLQQNIDVYVAVRNARTVLIDDSGPRAVPAVRWLRRMGFPDVYGIKLGDELVKPRLTGDLSGHKSVIETSELRTARQRESFLILDFRASRDYLKGHIEDSKWYTRANPNYLEAISPDRPIVIIADNEKLAACVLDDARRCNLEAFVLKGDQDHWKMSGLPVVTQNPEFFEHPNDYYPDPGDFDDDAVNTREGRHYLNWEIQLLQLIEGDPAARFS